MEIFDNIKEILAEALKKTFLSFMKTETRQLP